MERIKKNVIQDFQQMIYNSWTYGKMTPQEKHQWAEALDHIRTCDTLKGTYNQRWETLQAIYHTFLLALNYNWNWRREENESEATF